MTNVCVKSNIILSILALKKINFPVQKLNLQFYDISGYKKWQGSRIRNTAKLTESCSRRKANTFLKVVSLFAGVHPGPAYGRDLPQVLQQESPVLHPSPQGVHLQGARDQS
jgi:hypothetical protein